MALHHMLRAAVQQQAGGPSDPYFYDVSLLLTGDGTNGAQNNTFLDSSTNNFTITRNGNTTQGTFSPYGSFWSNYFDGSGDYLSIGSQAALGFGTGDWTIETFVYAPSTSSATSQRIWSFGDDRDGLEIVSGNFQSYNGTVRTIGTANANTWVHVAGVRNSGTIYWYINGILATSYVDSTNSSARTLDIGTVGTFYSPKIQFYTGYLSNLRIVKGTALYTSNFTPSTIPLTAVSGTSLLTCQSNRFIDNSSNNFTLTVNGNTSVQRFSPFNPTAPYSASTIGGSGYFDGSGDYLSVPDDNAFWIEGDFTIEAWVYPLSSADSTILAQWPAGGSNTSFTFRYGATTGRPYFAYSTNGTAGLGGSGTTTSVILNQWNHIAVSRSGSTVRLFVNGIVDSTTFTVSGALYNSTAAISNSTVGAYFPTGYISQIRFVKGTAVYTGNYTVPTSPLTAITNTSLLCNFTNAGIPDAAMMNDLETVGNAQVSTSVKKYGTGSLYFDGSGDYLTIPTNNSLTLGSGNWTVELWLNASASGYSELISWRNASVSSFEPDLYLWNTSVIVWYANGTALITGTTNVVGAGWVHVAVCKNGTSTKLFVNGVQEGSTYTDTNTYLAPNTSLKIGGNPANSQYLNGYIDDLRITKGLARYTANFTPPTAALPTY